MTKPRTIWAIKSLGTSLSLPFSVDHLLVSPLSTLRRIWFNRARALVLETVMFDRFQGLRDIPRHGLTWLAICHTRWHVGPRWGNRADGKGRDRSTTWQMGQRGDDLTVGTRRHGCKMGPTYEMGRKDECHQTSTWSSCSAVQAHVVALTNENS